MLFLYLLVTWLSTKILEEGKDSMQPMSVVIKQHFTWDICVKLIVKYHMFQDSERVNTVFFFFSGSFR